MTTCTSAANCVAAGTTVALVLVSFFQPAYGAVSSNLAQRSQGDALEEIIVTARRREENVQKVPIAITVVSQQKLQDNNIQTLGALQYLVPSMDASADLTRDALSVSIRGQGQAAFSSLPGVVAYLNEVPLPTDYDGYVAGGPGLMFDLENIEVLKGPQGTLFGRNTMGGAILFQSARPKNDLGGSLQLGYGNYNDREIDGNINIPIVNEVLLTRVAFSGALRDGFTHVLSQPDHPDGIDADNRDFWSVRASVTFRPSDTFQNDTIYTYSKYTSHGSPMMLTQCNPAGGLATLVFPNFADLCARQLQLGARTSLSLDTPSQSSGANLSLNNISRFVLSDNLTFRNIIGYAEAKEVLALDFDGTDLPIFNIPSPVARHTTFRQYTEEAQLLGKTSAGRLDWILGAFYLDDRLPPAVLSATILGGTSSAFQSRSDTSKALYMQGTYDMSALASGLNVTAGLRYTNDRRSNDSYGPSCAGPGAGPSCPPTNYVSDHALTWTAGLDYQAAPNTLLYLTSRRGYRAGGFNVDNNGNPLGGFGPEYVTDVELGVKSDWNAGDIRIRTNADVFYQDYRDIAATQLFCGAQGCVTITGNAAGARLWGSEFEASAQLTPHLQFGVTFNSLNFKYTDFGPGVDPTALLTGRNAGRIPYKYGLNGSYQLPLNPQLGILSAQVDWNWQSSYGDFTQPGGSTPAFGLLNLAVNWKDFYGKPIDLSLFASNLSNKVYGASLGGAVLYDSFGYTVTRFGEPRMYGVRFRFRFGAEGHK